MSLDRIVDALVVEARPLILEEWGVHSCIASTRIGLAVLEHFGISAEAMPVSVVAYNPAAARQLDETGRVEWNKGDGAWSVGITPGLLQNVAVPNPWSGGHLVVLVHEGLILVDLSADQLARPHRGLPVQPCSISGLTPEFMAGTGRIAVDFPSGFRLGYSRTLDAPDWRRCGDWRKHDAARRAVAGKTIRAIRARLDW